MTNKGSNTLMMFAFAAAAFLNGCQKYSVSVNDNVVYTPAPIFKDFHIVDLQLKTCVEQTLQDLHITRAQDLTRLNCSDAGIKSLDGLAKFSALESLNLAHNELRNISELNKLGQLQELILAHNHIKEAAPLLTLLHLQLLSLENNPELSCGDITQLKANLDSKLFKITLPSQCTH